MANGGWCDDCESPEDCECPIQRLDVEYTREEWEAIQAAKTQPAPAAEPDTAALRAVLVDFALWLAQTALPEYVAVAESQVEAFLAARAASTEATER